MNRQILSLAVAAVVSDVALAEVDTDHSMVIEINRGLPYLETAVRERTTGVKAAPVADGESCCRA